jgi:hypothetical protein
MKMLYSFFVVVIMFGFLGCYPYIEKTTTIYPDGRKVITEKPAAVTYNPYYTYSQSGYYSQSYPYYYNSRQYYNIGNDTRRYHSHVRQRGYGRR